MKFFNVGALELLFILLLALIVLGPRKAIKTAGDVGQKVKELLNSKFWREIVTTSKEIQDLPKKIMDEADIQKTIEELERSTGEVNHALRRSQADLRRGLTEIEQDIHAPHQTPPDPEENEENEEN